MIIKDKTAIITGVSSEIGYAIALAFAKEGYNVVVSDPDYGKAGEAAAKITSLGEEALSVKCDPVKKEETDDLLVKTLARYKKIDALVNCVEKRAKQSFMSITIADWEATMNINFRGALLLSQSVAKEMKTGGSILHISSVASSVGFAESSAYAASKGGVEALTRAMAFELAEKNIRANSLALGIIDTSDTSESLKKSAGDLMITTPPEKMLGTPEDVANAAVFLSGEKARYITGQTIVLDGGYTLR